MSTKTMPTQPRTTRSFDNLLAPGEKVLWRAKPVRRAFVFRTWPLSVFGLLLVVSVFVVEWVAFGTEAPDWLALYAVPFGLAGLYMLVGHFLVTSYEWAHTEYMITESRVLIRHGIFSPAIKVYSLLGLPHIEIEMHGKNIGNIMFKPQQGEGYGPWPGYQTMWPYTPGYLVGMLYIEDPVAVGQLIEGARRGPLSA